MEKHYAESARKARSGKINTAKDLLRAMTDVVPSDPQFESDFATATVSRSYLARYYLRALELQVRGEAEPELVPNSDEEVINLEHILPQSPSPGWNIDADTARAYSRRIGNLVLLQAGPNSLLGNEPFSKKKPVLTSSSFSLTSEVGKYLGWGPTEINERQKNLARIAVKTWPLKV